jgi:hypothetical protein
VQLPQQLLVPFTRRPPGHELYCGRERPPRDSSRSLRKNRRRRLSPRLSSPLAGLISPVRTMANGLLRLARRRSFIGSTACGEMNMKSAFGLIATAVLSVGCGGQPQSTVTTPATAYSAQAYSNLAQLMRGIPFTFANVVFDAQSEDPGAARDPAAVGGGATAMFKNVYGGWQEVENNALALSEAANLILVPGRLCENGRCRSISQTSVPRPKDRQRLGRPRIRPRNRKAWTRW